MATVKLGHVVNQLLQDSTIISDYGRFYDALDVRYPEYIQLTNRYKNAAAKTCELFYEILQYWVNAEKGNATIFKLCDILKGAEFVNAADNILKLGDPTTLIVAPTRQQPSNSTDISQADKSFNITPPIRTFVGRENELVQVKEYFKEKRTCVVTSAMGGQGKTQLCKKFVEQIQDENPSQIVTWFQGDTYDQLVASISQYTEQLGLQVKDSSGKPYPVDKLINNISAKLLPRKFPWLVVIDNVDSEYDGFPEVIEEFTDSSASVLITTRRANLLHGETEQLKLQSLSDEDAYKLVHNALKNVDHADVQLLCKLLGNHALACAQAVAYIRAQQNCSTAGKGYKISDYITEFNQDKAELVKYKLKLSKYDETIYLVVNKTMKFIREADGQQGEMSQKIMDVLCLVRPDGIMVEYLNKLVDQYVLGMLGRPMKLVKILQKVDQLAEDDKYIRLKYFNAGLFRLQEFSLINLDYEEVSVHRMVQKIAKIDSEYAAGYVLIPIVELEKTTAPELQHVMSIWDSIVTHDKKRAVFTKPNMAHQIFSRMKELPMVTELVAFAKTNYDLLSILLGKESIPARQLQFYIGWALNENGKYQGAIDMFETMLATPTSNEISDERYAEVLKVRIQAAKVCLNVTDGKLDGNLEKNLTPFINIFSDQLTNSDIFNSIDLEKPLQKLAQNPEKLDAISSKMTDMFMTENSFADQNDLAKLRRLVELSESDDFGEEAVEKTLEMGCGEETPVQNLIELVKTVIGDEPIAPSSGAKGDEFVSLLGNVLKQAASIELMAAGKHSEAIANLRELYESFKTKYGEAHKFTLSTRSALSDSLWEAGNKEEALQIKREVVAVEKKARGLDHPMTLRNIQLLAEWEAAMATTNMNQHPVP